MSEAIIRKCNKCTCLSPPNVLPVEAIPVLTAMCTGQNPFVKSDGCNKITCTRCGAVQCYVCRKTVKDYSHFNNRERGGKNGQCPLFDSTALRHQDEVQQAEESAREKVAKERPDIVS